MANAYHVVTVAPAGARPIAVASALQVVFLVWIAGVATGGGLLLLRVARLRRLTRKAEAVADGDWRRLTAEIAARYGIRRPVVLLTTGASDILATWGLLTPRVLLPADAPTWSGERARIVLLHELAHIKRWDWAVQMSADAIRTVFWFNPLFWILCARLRREGERASDDIVLGAGVRAATYASHLVDIARLCRRPSGWVPAVSIAHPSTLERRIVAMLNTGLNRQAPTWRATAAILVALVAIVFPTASFDVSAQAGPHALMGSIYDTTGLVLPGVDVTLVDEQDVSRSLVTDTRGAFRFTSVGTGTYVLEVSEPGFRSLRNEFTLETARDWYRNITMQAQSAKPAPPEDSPELFRAMEFRFHPQGEQAQRHYTTYFGMMEGTEYVSKPSLGEWIPYASAAEVVVADAERLWRSGLLDSIWVDVTDQPYENGVAGKHVIFNFVESSQIQPEPADLVPEVRERVADPCVAPLRILDRHPDHERGDFAARHRPASTAAGAAVVFLGDQSPVPAKDRVRGDDARDLPEDSPAEFVAAHSESPTLGVGQAKRPRAQIFPEDPILLPEILDQIVLVAVHPASEREDEELQRRRHGLRLLGRPDQHRPDLGRLNAPYAVTFAC